MKRLRLAFLTLLLAFTPSFLLSGTTLYPQFTLKSLDGTSYSNRSLRGKAVFITFFARACKPCQKEVPFLNELQKKYKDTLAVIAIAFMENDEEKVRALARQWGIEYPICLDPDGRASLAMEVSALPKGFLLDHKGRIINSFEGMSDKNCEKLTQTLSLLQRVIQIYRDKGPAFYIAPLQEATDDAAGQGKIWQDKITSWISTEGIMTVPSPDDADYVITGNVSRISNTVGIEIVISYAGVEDARLSDRVLKGDDARLRRLLLEKIRQFPYIPARE